jgi:uncharacterized membrane protein
MQFLVCGLLWFSAIGCGVMAGVYFAFSVFVMPALGRIDQAGGMAAMNAINVDILNSLFMPLFFGTSLAAFSLAILALVHWGEAGTVSMLVGGVLYVGGMFIVTVAFNVPLNDALASADPGTPASRAIWSRFLSEWTVWNHIRAGASAVASGLFISALISRGAGAI